MGDYNYRLLGMEDLKQLNELYTAAFGREKKDHFFEWKYFNNPAGNAVIAGAFYNDKLAGSGAMVPEKMNVFAREETVFKCTDLMTHPEHQRKGLSKKINELLIRETSGMNAPFSYTLCSNISTKSFLKNNWTFIEKAVNFFKPYALLKISDLLRKNDPDNIISFNSVDDHLEGYHFYVNAPGICVKKTSPYLKWRTANPGFSYKLVCHYNSSKQITGYLIYSISKNNVLNVIDIESAGNDKTVIDKLLSFAEHTVVKGKYKGIVIMTINNSPFYNFIKSRNYLRNPFNRGPLRAMLDFNIFKYAGNAADLTDIGLWDIYGLSYDDI